MTSAEYRELREQLGLTQRALAEQLDVHVQTVKTREGGAPINREAALAIKALAIKALIQGRIKA